MAGLHLNHMVSWSDLLESHAVYKDHGIELPVGGCKLIHLDKKKNKLQLDNREYLADKVCTDSDCKTTGTKIFRKSENKKISFTKNSNRNEYSKERANFEESLTKAIHEFAQTERRKIKQRNVAPDQSELRKQTIERLKAEDKWVKPEHEMGWCYSGNCILFTILMELGETETLLSFSNEEIESVLRCTHGSQAVGNNICFLTYYVMRVYISTNLIYASGFYDKPEEWGPLKPDSYFMREIMYDCDGQRFLYSSRRFLDSSVFMKDWDAMRELSKVCFRFFYLLQIIREEVGISCGIKDDVHYAAMM